MAQGTIPSTCISDHTNHTPAPGPLDKLHAMERASSWALGLCQQLGGRLQNNRLPDRPDVDLLASEQTSTLTRMVQSDRHSAQRYVQLVGRMGAPYDQHLRGQPQLLQHLESVWHYPHVQHSRLAHVNIPATLACTFPRASPPTYQGSKSPAGSPHLPPLPEPRSIRQRAHPDPPRSLHLAVNGRAKPELPLPGLGSTSAQLEDAWRTKLGLEPKSLTITLPPAARHQDSSSTTDCRSPEWDLPGQGLPVEWRPPHGGVESDLQPGSGEWLVPILAKIKLSGKTDFYYLNVRVSQEFRPYDLIVVSREMLNPEHFVFSTFGVLSITPGQESSIMSLGEWQREAMLWRALRHIPFFRNYLMRKTFTCWYRNTRQQWLQKQISTLWGSLLSATPHFGAALLHITRLIQELHQVKWLPVDAPEPLTLGQFKQLYNHHLSDARSTLEKFCHFCSRILQLVHKDSFEMFENSKRELQRIKVNFFKAPVHIQRVQQQLAERRLQECRLMILRLQCLGTLAAFMAVQNLTTVAQNEIIHFVGGVLQSRNPLLKVKLLFDDAGHFIIQPCRDQLLETMSGVLRSVGKSMMEVLQAMPVGSPPQPEAEELESGKMRRELPWSFEEGSGLSVSKECERHWAGDFGDEDTQSHVVTKPLSSNQPSLLHPVSLSNQHDHRGQGVSGEPLTSHFHLTCSRQLREALRADRQLGTCLQEQSLVIKAALKETLLFRIRHLWLLETHQLIRAWGPAGVEEMRRWKADQFQERITLLRKWQERGQSISQLHICTNRLLVFDCSFIHLEMVPALQSMQLQMLQVLKEVTEEQLTALTKDLTMVIQHLKEKPADVAAFGSYIDVFDTCSERNQTYRQTLDQVHALLKIIRSHFQHHALYQEKEEEQVEYLWNTFLQMCREASEYIRSQHDSVLDSLEQERLLFTAQVLFINSKVGSASFCDPSQNALATLHQLQQLRDEFLTMAQRLQELSQTNHVIKGKPLNLSFLKMTETNIACRRELWNLFFTASEEVKQWRKMQLSQIDLQAMSDKLDRWISIAQRVRASVPADDKVLLSFDEAVSELKQFLPVLVNMCQPEMKARHWLAIFTEMGETWSPEWQMKISDLLAYNLPAYSTFIKQVLAKAMKECELHKLLVSVKRFWQSCEFRLVTHITVARLPESCPHRSQRSLGGKFSSPSINWMAKNSGALILVDIERLQGFAEDSVMTLNLIMTSPAMDTDREEAAMLMEMVGHFAEFLDLWKNFQDKWVFLHQIFSEMEVKALKQDLVLISNIEKVDSLYRRVIEVLSTDPRIQSLIQDQDTMTFGDMTLRDIFRSGISAMEDIIVQMSQLLDSARQQFPRLHFLTDDDLHHLIPLLPNPRKLLPFIRKCFVNVQDLHYEALADKRQELIIPQTKVLAIYGHLKERLELLAPLEPGHSVVTWLHQLETSIRQSLFRSLENCITECTASAAETNRIMLESLHKPNAYKAAQLVEQVARLGSSYPVQCILIAQAMCWQQNIEKALFTPSSSKAWFTAFCSAKIERLALATRTFCKSLPRGADEPRLLCLLKSLTLSAISHRDLSNNLMAANIESETSFQWQRLLKYHVDFNWLFPKRECTNPMGTPCSLATTEPQQRQFGLRCYVRVLSSSLFYDYEYVGPSPLMVQTSLTERSCLALVLAVQNYNACALVGPSGTGKTTILSHLAHALGIQLVTLHCGEGFPLSFLTQVLRGAVQSGAWLLMKNVDELERGTLSILAQHLITVQSSYRKLISTCNLHPPQPRQATGSSHRVLGRSLTDLTESDHLFRGPRRTGSSEDLRLQDPTSLGSIVFGGNMIPARIVYATVMTLPVFDSRITLPENLRSVLRPVGVARPDIHFITQVKLLTLGFSNPDHLARKLATFFEEAQGCGFLGDYSCLPVMDRVLKSAAKVLYQRLNTLSPPAQSGAGTDRANRENSRSTSAALFESTVLLEEFSVLNALLETLSKATSHPEKQQSLKKLLKDLFPTAWPTLLQEDSSSYLLAAIKQSLVDTAHEATQEMITNTLALYQALRVSKGVIIFGPSGSGKTTSYRTLSRVLNQFSHSDGRETDNDLTGLAVQVSVCFPNTLTTKELLGALRLCSRTNGGLNQCLGDTKRQIPARDLAKSFQSLQVKPFSRSEPRHWIVLDGELCLDWIRPISTLLAHDSTLTLSNGEQLSLPPFTSFILEVCDLSNAPPSAVTWSSLLQYQGSGAWEAVFNRTMDSMYSQYIVHRETLALWKKLAQDLIPNTLQFLQQHCAPVLNPWDQAVSQKHVCYGLQEVTSFSRILCGLLQKYLSRDQQRAPPGRMSTPTQLRCQRSHLDEGMLPRHHELASSILAMAFIWGFGGHLHSRHWPQFDNFARCTLQSSIFPINIPLPGLVYDYYINPTTGCLQTFDRVSEEEWNKAKGCGYILVPEVQIYIRLLELLPPHPVLLVGQSGHGKTSLLQALQRLGTLPPASRLPVSPHLRPRHVWQHLSEWVLPQHWSRQPPSPSADPPRTKAVLVFLDDIHMADYKPGSECQPVVETIRHSLTCHGTYDGDGQQFRSFQSAQVSFMATCTPCHEMMLCPRFTRLMTVLALPAITWDTLTTIYMPRLLAWLATFPTHLLSRPTLLAKALVYATAELYQKVKGRFLSSPTHPHYLFSVADIGKVLRALLLMYPPSVDTLKLSENRVSKLEAPLIVTQMVVGLWQHESMRTFSDCLETEEDRTALSLILQTVAHTYFSTHNVQVLFNQSLLRRIIEPQALASQSDPLACDQVNLPISMEMQDADVQGEVSHMEDHLSQDPKGPLPVKLSGADSGALIPETPGPREPSDAELLLRVHLSDESYTTSRPHVTIQPPASQLSDSKEDLGMVEGKVHYRSQKPLLPLHLLYTEKALRDLIFCKGVIRPDNRQQMNSPWWNPYSEVSYESLAQQLRQVVLKLNHHKGTNHQVIFFKEAVHHFARISRVLSIPGAHCALVSSTHCTGRKTLVRLAAYLSLATVFELRGQMSRPKVASIFKQASKQAGIEGRCTIIMVHSGVGQETLQELFSVMAEGRFPGLYSTAELTLLAKQFTSSSNLVWNGKEEQALQRFFLAVKKALHVVLLWSISDSELLDRWTGLPHFLGAMGYVDMWQQWNQQAFMDMVTSHLGIGNLSTLTRTTGRSVVTLWMQVPIIIRIMALIHQSVLSYAKHMAPSLPLITPAHLLDFIDLFSMIFHHLKQSKGLQIERVELGLDKIQEMYNSAEEYRKEIELLKHELELLVEEKKQMQEYFAKLRGTFVDILTRNRNEETQLSLLQCKLEAARKAFGEEYGMVKSHYLTALQALKSLSSSDLDEVRTYRAPPLPVVTVMNTLCTMFGRPHGWDNVKQLISQPNFYLDLEFYDKENIPDHVFKTLGSVILKPEFQPDAVREVSKAVESFSLWIRAVYYHATAVRDYTPTFINQFQAQVDEVQARLGLLRKQAFKMKKDLVELLREDREGYLSDSDLVMDVADTDVLSLLEQKEQDQVHRLEAQEQESLTHMRQRQQELQRSEEMIHAFYPHQSDWFEAVQQSRGQRLTVCGDGLLTAAAVIYLGPFEEKMRWELLDKWKVACHSGKMEMEPRDVRQELLDALVNEPASSHSTDPTSSVFIPCRNNFLLLDMLSSLREQLDWNSVKLPVNATARDSILITQTLLTHSPIPWILLVDPDQQEEVWMGVLQAGGGLQLEQEVLAASVNEEMGTTSGVDTDTEEVEGDLFDDIQAEEGAEMDWVPEKITEQPPNNLWVCPITRKNLDQQLLTAAMNGIAVLVTNIELRPFTPVLRHLLKVRRWQMKQGSWHLSLGKLRIQVKHTFRLYLSTSLPLRKIKSEMDPVVLKHVRWVDISISHSGLQELILKEVLYWEKHRSEQIALSRQTDIMYLQHQLQVTQEELMDKVIQTATSLLNVPTIHEAALQNQQAKMEIRRKLNALTSNTTENPYVAISNIGSEMYWALVHISQLNSFYYFSKISFMKVVRAVLSNHLLSNHLLTNTSKNHYVELMDHLISRIYCHFRWCMFVRHAQLYRFLVAIGHMRVVNMVTQVEWEFFLHGIHGLKVHTSLQDSAHNRPAWVSQDIWKCCGVLELLPAFSNLRLSLITNARQWQEYFRLTSTVIGMVPCTSFAQLTIFQRAILWRIFQPNLLSVIMNDVVTCDLGGTLVMDLRLTLPSLFNYSRQTVPVIFLMPTGSSVNHSTHPLYWIKQMAAQHHMENKVHIISLGSEDQTEEIVQELKKVMSQGHWLVLDNCHLLEHWDLRLVRQLTELVTASEIYISSEVTTPSTSVDEYPCEDDSGKPVQTLVTESGEKIHLDFRLWLVCQDEEGCSMPGVVRRHSEKLVLETPSTLRNTLRCTYSQAQAQDVCRGSVQPVHVTLLTALHAVLLHRQHYSHWVQAHSYRWTEADLFAALDIERRLQAACGDDKSLLEHLAGVVVHQGHVLDGGDEVALRSVINHCVRTSSYVTSSKGIQGLISCLTSSTGDAYYPIELMTSRMDMGAVGLSEGLERLLIEEDAADTSLILHQSQWPWLGQDPGLSGFEQLLVEGLVQLERLCSVEASGGAESERPVLSLVLQEYRQVQQQLRSHACALTHALEGLRGLACCSGVRHRMCGLLQQGHVPSSWCLGARQSVPLPLWLHCMETRVRLLEQYIQQNGLTTTYNLSAFRRPRLLLLCLLQQRARQEQRPLDTYRLHAQVLSSSLPPASPPVNGIYVTGLHLHGALWDSKLGLLQDTVSISPCSMPVVWFQPEEAEVAGSRSLHPEYKCPVYVGAENQAVHLADKNMITSISIASKLDPQVCAQRRVHITSLLCSPETQPTAQN
ncbi:dynein heavy chain domain-containing protein 1 isoform X2 [Narcine bancroftii]